MGFNVDDFHDLVTLLDQRPDLRAQVRGLVLTDDVLALPGIVMKLAEAQQRTEASLERLTERVDTLVQAQQGTEKRLHELSGDFRGDKLERKYRDNAPGYFGRILRRSRVLSKEDLDALLPEPGERLSQEERDRMLMKEIVIRGQQPADRAEAYLAVEVSVLVELHDVARARDRARLLSKATGKTTLPVVAGDRITDEAQQVAAGEGVWRVLDGSMIPPTTAPPASG